MYRANRFPVVLLLVSLLFSACQPVVAPMAETTAPLPQVEILATGAPFHSANGPAFGPDGNLYFASVGGREIIVMNPETGAVIKRLGQEVGVTSPDDITFGPDGSLYWTNLMTGEVGRLTPDGTATSQKVALGVNPITFSDDGRLFVALDFFGDAFYELDPALVEPPRLLAEQLGFLNAFDFGPDGYLYGPLYIRGQFVRIDVNADPVTIETIADGFILPAAAKFDAQGRLHLLDQATGEVAQLNLETGEKSVIATLPPGIDNLAFDAQDRLFVTHNSQATVFELMADGTVRTVSPGGMTAPTGVAIMTQNGVDTIYTSNVMAINPFDAQTGKAGSPYEANAVTVALDGENLLLTSWFANSVEIWNPATGKAVASYHDFAVPLNAIRFQGDLIVAELGTASVVRVNGADPTQRTPLITEMGVPAGLAATADELWVSDFATGQILQLAAGGEMLAEPALIATGLVTPEGLAMTADGLLLVVESSLHRLSAVDLETGEIMVIAENLALGLPPWPGMPPLHLLNGLTVDSAGTIYVTGDIDNVIYRITLAQ
jgi:sugar lactone lactonase YvrE